jgi:hypothetical protein
VLTYVPADFTSSLAKPKSLSVCEKMEIIFAAMKELDITYGELVVLPHTQQPFRQGGSNRVALHDVQLSPSIRQSAAKFLLGQGSYRFSDLLAIISSTAWRRDHSERTHDFSLNHPVDEILHARPALSAYAAQAVCKKLRREWSKLVDPRTGLHACATENPKKHPVTWDAIGSNTLETVAAIIAAVAPFLWALLLLLATPKKRKYPEPATAAKATKRAKRAEMVVQRTRFSVARGISTLLYSHNRDVKLLPVSDGIFYMSSGVQQKILDYGSRSSHVPCYKTVYNTLSVLGGQEIRLTESLGLDPAFFGKLVLDNIDQYARVHEARIWRESQLQHGTAATLVEMEGVDPRAFDVDDKLKRIAEAGRKKLTSVDRLRDLVDDGHLRQVYSLHWLLTLVSAVPRLRRYIPEVLKMFEAVPKNERVAYDRKTKIHPTKSTGQNQTKYSEFAAALYDLLACVGQRKGNNQRKMWLLGGDGKTYELLIALINLLQFQEDDVESLRLLRPCLELFHLIWTDLTRLCDTHWGSTVSQDPSTLGKNANEIHRKQPNLKKVEYYSTSSLAFLVLQAQLLDAWR